MNTPIIDFVEQYKKNNITRLHMPGHKGKHFLGFESSDITEVKGADALYEADGIIAQSEANATKLFETGKTLYSTEGSSQCIRAMLYLAVTAAKKKERAFILAARNVHKSFVQAVALLDLDVEWIYPEGDMHSLCSCEVNPGHLHKMLNEMDEKPIAVYLTSPDYLGGQSDVRKLADVCHQNGTILAVDNAHGAYLKFLKESKHPIDLGADICCDSAHKTLPVLTGGAYLHIHKEAPKEFMLYAKQAMALFGSTSPSYLALMSLDKCNQYLADGYQESLMQIIKKLNLVRKRVMTHGWKLEETDPLKITVAVPDGMSGHEVAERLRSHKIECEYADPDYVVCMVTPENTVVDFEQLVDVLGVNEAEYTKKEAIGTFRCDRKMSVRDAVFARHIEIDVSDAKGRICAAPTVSCPPAIPIVVSGEEITEEAIRVFQYYGINKVDVVEE